VWDHDQPGVALTSAGCAYGASGAPRSRI
jgi:hypothetical protein